MVYECQMSYKFVGFCLFVTNATCNGGNQHEQLVSLLVETLERAFLSVMFESPYPAHVRCHSYCQVNRSPCCSSGIIRQEKGFDCQVR